MNEKLYEMLAAVQRTAVQISEMAVDAAYGAGKKASELAAVAKIKLRIMDLNGEVNAALQEVGEILYATHTGMPSDSEILLAKLQKIDALKADIQALNDQIGAEQVGRACCGTCGAAVCEDAVFCGECGEKL